MGVREALLPEFDQEMAQTRRTLERVPSERFSWKPHDKSFSMGGLASHVANLPSWAALTLAHDSFDMAPTGKQARAAEAGSTQEALELFDKNVSAARAAIAAADDQKMFQTWTLLANGRKVLALPRAAVLRSFVMNHIIHHRAQLCVYLRMNDIPVPAIYGPSADESQLTTDN